MMDARNHGLSGHASANLQAMTDDLATVIQALNLHQPVVLGHSMGASMVADLAPQRGSRSALQRIFCRAWLCKKLVAVKAKCKKSLFCSWVPLEP
ncbi:alpha/beta fold hydrolase, partial [Pseudomonadales bacterium]|nr:alpha/beta fold hydrolase [Pseudomonadales bacterium]